MTELSRVGVLGCGLMGSGIAEVAARAGCDVVVREATGELAERGEARVRTSLERAVKAGKMTGEQLESVLGRLRVTADLEAMSDREIVVEAIAEHEPTKVAALAEVDRVLPEGSILASNTSSIPIIRLAMATSRPGKVLGMHFFNPVPVMPLLEIVASVRTDPEVVAAAVAFGGGQLAKTVIHAKDRAGFVVNTLLAPYLLSAVRMFESGFASAQDIDAGMEKGCAHPMGPLRLSDLIGLDTLKLIADSLYEEFKEPTYAAPPLLQRMVEAGWLGRKSGRGFYTY